eukprot:1378673-Pleurochrysis_carterae.AAC.1
MLYGQLAQLPRALVRGREEHRAQLRREDLGRTLLRGSEEKRSRQGRRERLVGASVSVQMRARCRCT